MNMMTQPGIIDQSMDVTHEYAWSRVMRSDSGAGSSSGSGTGLLTSFTTLGTAVSVAVLHRHQPIRLMGVRLGTSY